VPIGLPHSQFLSWDETDQDKALAFMRDRRNRCPGCGTHEDEWERDPDAYVGWHESCPGCARLEQESENVSDSARGVKRFLIPRAEAERRMESITGFEDEPAETEYE
jgi:hypothetical protein